MEKSKLTEALQVSATTIEEISNLTLSDGSKISQILILEDVELWRVAQPDLALHVLPPVLFRKDHNSNLNYVMLKNYIKGLKYCALEFYKLFFNCFEYLRGNDKDCWFLLSSSGYIYRDTLLPIQEEIETTYTDLISFENFESLFSKERRIPFFSFSWLKKALIYFKCKIRISRVRREFFRSEFEGITKHFKEIPPQSLKFFFYGFFGFLLKGILLIVLMLVIA